eukprot:370597-Prymnesium_polylepis.3
MYTCACAWVQELRLRLREYFHRSSYLRQDANNKQLMQAMSPGLQAEVAWTVHASVLENLSFLKGAPRVMMTQLALLLQPAIFAPGEVVPTGRLYIISRGIALYRGGVLSMGRCFGDDLILDTKHLRQMYCARAMNYLELSYLDRESLNVLASGYPIAAKRIRWCAIRLALRREMLLRAKLRLAVMKASPKCSLAKVHKELSTRSLVGKNNSFFDRMLIGTITGEDKDLLEKHSRFRKSITGGGGGLSDAAEQVLLQVRSEQQAQAATLAQIVASLESLSAATDPGKRLSRARTPASSAASEEDRQQDGHYGHSKDAVSLRRSSPSKRACSFGESVGQSSDCSDESGGAQAVVAVGLVEGGRMPPVAADLSA